MAHQTAVRSRLSQAFEGGLAYNRVLNEIITLINVKPAAKQTHTFVIATATSGATYSVVINGVTVSFVAVGSTKAAIVAELTSAIDQEPLVRRSVSAADDATDTTTITSLIAGRGFTASSSDVKVTSSSGTANDTADTVPVGRGVTASGFEAGSDVLDDSERGHICAASLMTAQVWTFTGASIASGDSIYGIIEVDGIPYTLPPVAFSTDNNTTVAAVATMLNAILPANTVAATASTGVLTLTAEVAGKTFAAHFFAQGSGGGTFTPTSFDLPPAESFWYGFGVSVRGYDEEKQTDGTFAYPGNAGLRSLIQGHIWVRHNGTTAPSANDPVYMYVGSTTADQGKFYNAAGTDRVLVPKDLAKWRGLTSRDSGTELALLELRPRQAA